MNTATDGRIKGLKYEIGNRLTRVGNEQWIPIVFPPGKNPEKRWLDCVGKRRSDQYPQCNEEHQLYEEQIQGKGISELDTQQPCCKKEKHT